MDPDAILREQREVARRITSGRQDPGDGRRLAELSQILDSWLSRTGTPPSEWPDDRRSVPVTDVEWRAIVRAVPALRVSAARHTRMGAHEQAQHQACHATVLDGLHQHAIIQVHLDSFRVVDVETGPERRAER
jgi:hypothetical protein